MIPEELSESSMQFETFDAFTAFLNNIFLNAYLNCKLFKLLFHPPLALRKKITIQVGPGRIYRSECSGMDFREGKYFI